MSSRDRQSDVVERHRDVGGQDIDECRLIPDRLTAGDDVTGKVSRTGKVIAPQPETGRAKVRVHARRLVDAVSARRDAGRRPAFRRLCPDAEQTVAVCQAAPKAVVIAIHMDTLDHGTVSRANLRTATNAAGIHPDRFLIPADGECLSFS